jgi:hypothetical protein
MRELASPVRAAPVAGKKGRNSQKKDAPLPEGSDRGMRVATRALAGPRRLALASPGC